MKKAVFLDRDGVLNREMDDYTWTLDRFEVLPDVIPALQKLQKKGYMLIVITNQGGISKGLFNHEDVDMLHTYLKDKLAEGGVKLDEIYYCSHHPMNAACICRKPDSLFVEKGLARFNIDPGASYFIGDKERDILAAKKGGVKGILIEQNTSLLDAIKQIT